MASKALVAQATRRPKPAGRRLIGDYMVVDPKICHGALTFVGTRVFVSTVLEMVADEMDWDRIIWNYYGHITKEAIAEAVRLAGEALARRVAHKVDS